VPKAPRVPDPIWDSICCSFGLNPVTKSERTRVGGITRDLKLKGASPDDIATRITTYRRQWPKMTCTPEALLKHWDSLGSSDNGATEQDPLALHNGRVLAQEAQERKNA